MMKLKKLRPVKDELNENLRDAIGTHSEDQNVAEIMLKDAHLIEAALATDRRIVSLDEAVRGHFRRLAATFDILQRIDWANPVIEDEQATEWLQTGARADRSRLLKP